MLPSSSTPHQAVTLPPGAAYLYLLVSQQEPEACKLGVAKRPAMRFDALTKRFGPFDLQASLLVVAKNRRAALDLEGLLQTVFAAPSWRVQPQVAAGKNGRTRRTDGDTEWYRMAAFEPMANFIDALAEHDYGCDLHRFKAIRNIQDSGLWQEHLRNAGVQTRYRSAGDLALATQKKLAQNETRFAAVQAWMQQHRHQLVSVTPFTCDREGNRRRTFVYRGDDTLAFESDEAGTGDWEDLAASCVVSHVSERGCKSFTYFGAVTAAADASTYRVEFLLTPSFAQEATDCPSLGDLLTRIEDWLSAPPL